LDEEAEKSRTLRARCVVAAGIGLMVAATAVPLAYSGVWLPDSIEHMAIAYAWVHGAGFVDPVQWTYDTPLVVPLPAVAVRPPLVSVFLALPFALGASIYTIFELHAVWAALAVSAAVLVASRGMRLPAAMALGLSFGFSPTWLFPASQPMTEATGVLAYLAVLATARGVLRSVPAAFACAALTVVAWLARPNLGAVWLAVFAAAVWERGIKRSVREAPLWTYALGFPLLAVLARLGIAEVTGGLLYSGYGDRLREIDEREFWRYGKLSLGTWTHLQQNAHQIVSSMLDHWVLLVRFLFLSPAFNWIGWILAPGLLWALMRCRDGILEHRISAFCVIGFAFTVVLNYAAYEPRYLDFTALAGAFCGFAMLDQWVRRTERRFEGAVAVRWLSALPLVLTVLVVGLGSLPLTLSHVLQSWQRSQDHVVNDPRRHPLVPLCRYIDPDAIVATPDPWLMVLICGNAAMRLPWDLADPALRERFVAERHPAYFVAGADPEYAWLKTWDRVRERARSRDQVLYELRDPSPQSRPWHAPPPLMCDGSRLDCVRGGG
jgi:hypothetical protein